MGINFCAVYRMSCLGELISVIFTWFAAVFRHLQTCTEICRNIQKCTEMYINAQKYREIYRNVQKYRELHRNSESTHKMLQNGGVDVSIGARWRPLAARWRFGVKAAILQSPRRCRCKIQNLRTKCCRMVVSTSRLEPAEGLFRPVEDLTQRPQFCRAARGGVDTRLGI